MRIFILLLSLIVTLESNAQSYIVIYPADCINCMAGIYQLQKRYPKKNFKLVYPAEFKKDKESIIENFGEDKIKGMNLIFSDSFTSKYKLGIGSFLLLLNQDKVYFKQELKNIEYRKLDYAFGKLSILKNVRRIALDAEQLPARYLTTPYNSHYLAVENNFGKFSICDLETQQYRSLKVDNKMHKELYKILYADSFEYKYPIIKKLISEMPIYRPKLSEVKLGEDKKIYLQITITNYFLKQNKTSDTAFYFDNMIATYNFDRDKITSLHRLDNRSLLPMNFTTFIPLREAIAIHSENIKHPNKPILSLAKLGENGYEKVEETNVMKNSKFIEFKINNVGERLLNYENYIIGRYDNTIYDIVNKKVIDVKLADSFSADISQLYNKIRDPFVAVHYNKALSKNKKGELILLFSYKKNSFLFNINTSQLTKIPKQIANTFGTGKNYPLGFDKDAHTLVWLVWETKELIYYTHDLL